MTEEKLPVAVWQGVFRAFVIDVKCYVLDNGQRIIDANDMALMFANRSRDKAEPEQFYDLIIWSRSK